MSTLIVEVCEVDDVLVHPHADRLEILIIKGWRVVAQKDFLKKGDKCVYFPPDSVMTEEFADKLNIKKYLSILPKGTDGTRQEGFRVRATVLRGECSFGTIMECENPEWEIGKNVMEYYGITKFEPLEKQLDAEAEEDHPAFHHYTSIENIRNFPEVIKTGEEVIINEKIHGKNLRFGLIRCDEGMTFMAGSHNLRLKEINFKGNTNEFWKVFDEKAKDLLSFLSEGNKSIIIFAELFGQVQDMTYGMSGFDYRAFDISVDRKYLSYDEKKQLFDNFKIQMPPFLYRGSFSWDLVEQLTPGPTELCEPEKAGKFKGREGVVITPVVERLDFDLGGSGRVIVKSISAEYIARKGGTEFH